MVATGTLSIFVVGTRAQLIKVAPVVVACEQAGQHVALLLTGQHKETMQDLIDEFGIRTPPELIMEVSERSTILSLATWAPRALFALARRLRALRRTGAGLHVAVHGDTLSTVIGALAARLSGGKVFHVESGLSSGRLLDPFPEELARRIVFRLADVALCPGAQPAAYMRTRHSCRVVDTVDNTIVDAVRIAASESPALEISDERTGPYLVASLHRFQNIFDRDRLHFLAELIETLAVAYRIYFVLHPATRKRLQSEGLLERLSEVPNLVLSPRLGYRDFLRLASGAECVLTDGGSNQEELAVLGVPTIVMRERTERADGLGKNAVMERDIRGGLLPYIMGKEFAALRRDSAVALTSNPSIIIAHEMAG